MLGGSVEERRLWRCGSKLANHPPWRPRARGWREQDRLPEVVDVAEGQRDAEGGDDLGVDQVVDLALRDAL